MTVVLLHCFTMVFTRNMPKILSWRYSSTAKVIEIDVKEAGLDQVYYKRASFNSITQGVDNSKILITVFGNMSFSISRWFHYFVFWVLIKLEDIQTTLESSLRSEISL